jgi:hypothetical protein
MTESTVEKPLAVDRWRQGGLKLDEIRQMDAMIELVDVGRALRYSRDNALAEVKANTRTAPDGRLVSSLGGVPLVKRGRTWIAQQTAVLRALGADA